MNAVVRTVQFEVWGGDASQPIAVVPVRQSRAKRLGLERRKAEQLGQSLPYFGDLAWSPAIAAGTEAR